MKKLLILMLSLLFVPQITHSMQQPVASPQAIQTFARAMQQRLIERFGPTTAEFILQIFVRYLAIRDKYFPTRKKPIEQFDPLKYLIVSSGSFINRNIIKIGLTSSTILTFVTMYLAGKLWYQQAQERHDLYNDLLNNFIELNRSIGPNKATEIHNRLEQIKNNYDLFPDHAKTTELTDTINAYNETLRKYLNEPSNENKFKVLQANSTLFACIGLLKG